MKASKSLKKSIQSNKYALVVIKRLHEMNREAFESAISVYLIAIGRKFYRNNEKNNEYTITNL